MILDQVSPSQARDGCEGPGTAKEASLGPSGRQSPGPGQPRRLQSEAGVLPLTLLGHFNTQVSAAPRGRRLILPGQAGSLEEGALGPKDKQQVTDGAGENLLEEGTSEAAR